MSFCYNVNILLFLITIIIFNFQMQYSKTDTGALISKIEKIKDDINNATEYHHLENCSHKLAKLREKAETVLQRKLRKQLREMCEVAEGLIQLKTKKFKKRIIDQIAKSAIKQDRSKQKTVKQKTKQKTLAYSKSVDCFDLSIPNITLVKQEEQDSWQDKTQVHPRKANNRLYRRVLQLQEQLASYRHKLGKMEQGRSSATLTQLCLRMGQQEGLFQQQLGFKIREKALEVDQLRQNLRRSQERTNQLKSRLLNQQKRQEDYIQGLKTQLTASSQQLENANRENRRIQEELNKMYFVCDGYKTEVRRLMQESDQLRRQRSQAQQAELIRLKDNGMRKELEQMQQQDRYMRQMQDLLEAQQDRNAVLQTQVEQLERQNRLFQTDNDELQRKMDKLQQLLQIKEEQNAQIKEEFINIEKDKKACIAQLTETRETILILRNQIDNGKMRRNLELQKKAESLRQIKEMLESK